MERVLDLNTLGSTVYEFDRYRLSVRWENRVKRVAEFPYGDAVIESVDTSSGDVWITMRYDDFIIDDKLKISDIFKMHPGVRKIYLTNLGNRVELVVYISPAFLISKGIEIFREIGDIDVWSDEQYIKVKIWREM